MGVPRVTPCSIPDWRCTRSFSSLCVMRRSAFVRWGGSDGTHGRRQVTLARSTASELGLHVLRGKRESLGQSIIRYADDDQRNHWGADRWTAVDDRTDGSAVTFAVRRYAEKGAKRRHCVVS